MKTKNLSQLSVDGVLCISLINRQDRRDLISAEFADSGLKIEFLLVEPDKENPERGCFESHIKCANIALERNYKNVLILEDDATLLSFSPQKIDQINRFLSHRKPELLYFGATLGKLWLTWSTGIARYRTKGAFSYLLSNEGCKKLISFAPYSGTVIDKIFSAEFKAYGVFPLICQHQPEHLAKSNILHYRSNDGTAPDAEFWKSNWRRQFHQAFRNLGKTLIRKDI